MDILRKFVRIEQDATLGDRQIRVIASDATVDRVNDVMVAEGCDVSDYKSNPIILAQHDPNQPIGRSTISIQGGKVIALIDFAPAGISAKADEYCGLAKAGIINAASVGFEGVEAEPIKGGGKRYTKWKLMEISLVSVPANPSATVIARSLDTSAGAAARKRIKVGASRNLPSDVRSGWDDDAASRHIFEKSGFDGEEPNSGWARKAFLIYDESAPNSKDAYQLPFADVVDGRLTATLGGLRAAAAGLAKMSLPDDVRAKAQDVLNHYEAKMTGTVRSKTAQPKIKGLYDVAELARVLSNLGYIHDMAKWEAEVEADASKVPGMLALALQQTAASLIAMTQEEVNEMLAGRDIDIIEIDDVDDDYVTAGATPQIKAMRFAFRKAGRVLSRENSDHLDAISKCLGKMMDCRTKAADLHDDLHDQIVAMEDHGTSLGEHVKAMKENAKKKPNDTDGANDEGDDDSGDDGDDPDNTDGELAFEVAQRKRALEILAKA